MPRLEFDEKDHIYKLDGRIIPGVTTVLEDVGLVDFEGIPLHVLESAANFGDAVHKASHYQDRGELDEDSINDEIRSYLVGWQKFITDFQAQIIESEFRVYSEKWRYAGTMDRLLVIKDRLVIPDIKTGTKQRGHACQTAAYSLAYREMTGDRIIDRMTVYLSENNYKPDFHKDKTDETVFLSALAVYNYKRR